MAVDGGFARMQLNESQFTWNRLFGGITAMYKYSTTQRCNDAKYCHDYTQ